jgi:hypothetical protein
MTGKVWTQAAAIQLCREVENLCPEFGGHVALTGGTLYKDGPRKDADLLFYCIRQVDKIDEEGLLNALRDRLNFCIGKRHGWVTKATYEGRPLDLFFPEAYPARDPEGEGGEYGTTSEPIFALEGED